VGGGAAPDGEDWKKCAQLSLDCQERPGMESRKVIVVGAGIGGLPPPFWLGRRISGRGLERPIGPGPDVDLEHRETGWT
jgi:hypothetical protein